MTTATTAPPTTVSLTIARDTLRTAMEAVMGAVQSRASHIALANVLIEAHDVGEGQHITFTATDLDITITRRVTADVTHAGRILVAAKRLADIARELPPAPVHLSAAQDTVRVRCDRARFRLTALPPDHFPAPPTIPYDHALEVTGEMLTSLAERVAFAVSTEESRPILNGVLWELRPETMAMVGTNGHRLAYRQIAAAGQQHKDVIVPPKALDQVRRLVGATETVRVAVSPSGGHHLGFATEHVEIISRTIEGPYPEWRRVLPNSGDRVAIVDRLALLSAIRRVDVVSVAPPRRVRLEFSGEQVALAVDTPDLGEAWDEVPLLDYGGDPITIAFNAGYLLTCLRHLPTDSVRIELSSPERAAVLRPVDDPAGGESLMLLMPLRPMSEPSGEARNP